MTFTLFRVILGVEKESEEQPMYQEKEPTNHYVRCSECNTPLFRIDARHTSIVNEICPVPMCYKCLAELVKRAGESTRTYHIIAEAKKTYRYTVKANNPEEALMKFNEKELVNFEFLDSGRPVAMEVMLAPE